MKMNIKRAINLLSVLFNLVLVFPFLAKILNWFFFLGIFMDYGNTEFTENSSEFSRIMIKSDYYIDMIETAHLMMPIQLIILIAAPLILGQLITYFGLRWIIAYLFTDKTKKS